MVAAATPDLRPGHLHEARERVGEAHLTRGAAADAQEVGAGHHGGDAAGA